MKKNYLIISILFCTVLFVFSCKKETVAPPADPCTGVTISINYNQSAPTTGQSNGSITVTATPSGTYTYSINNGSYQSSNIFNNLAAGNYTIMAKNADGCMSTSTSVTLSATNPCNGVNIILTPATTYADLCPTSNNGSITLTASGSTGFTYSNDGGTTFQASNVFSNLAAANYPVVVKDVNGCTKSQTVTVSPNPGGVKFNLVRNLMIAKCGSCHFNGGNSGSVNFDDKCNIVTKWDRINIRCVVQGTMPQAGPLSTSEKQTITDWVNAGHRYVD
jgi:hypothetical protein